jgi:hypothetical protein
MKRIFHIVALICGLVAGSAFAQSEQFIVAGGGGAKNGSVYSTVIGEFATVCNGPSDLNIIEQNTKGGTENLELLRTNKVNGAIIPTDLYLAAKMDNPTSVTNLRTLFTLHNEDTLFIARADAKFEGGVTVFGHNVGGDKVEYNTVESLKGRPVGAVGGSVVTARITSDMLQLGLKIMSFTATKDMLTALENHQIDAVVISAGKDSPAVKSLPAGKFKILPLRANEALARVYKPTKAQYLNLNEGRAVDTLTARANFMVRTLRSSQALNKLAKLRKCFVDNLAAIQDKNGTAAAWQDVDVNDRGRAEWYDLPAVK